MDSLENKSGVGAASLGGAPYDLNQAIANSEQRIKNLESFRDLFFDLKDQIETGKVNVEILGVSGGSSLEDGDIDAIGNDPTNRLQNLETLAANKEKTITELKITLGVLRAQLEEHSTALEEKTVAMTQLKRQCDEAASCGEMVEAELERLIEENAVLKEGATLDEGQKGEIDGGVEIFGTDAESQALDLEALSANKEELKLSKKKIQELETELEQVTELAFSSMRSSADIGAVVHFLHQCFNCTGFDELMAKAVETIQNYGVQGVFEIRTEKRKMSLSTEGGEGASEDIDLLRRHWEESEFVDLGDRVLINGEMTSLIVQGFDKTDEIAFECLKDNLTMLIVGADSNSQRLYAEYSVLKQRANLERLIATTDKALNKFELDLKGQTKQAQLYISELVSNFRGLLAKQAIANDQKNTLLKSVVEGVSKIEGVIRSVGIDSSFKQVIKSLSESVSAKKKKD